MYSAGTFVLQIHHLGDFTFDVVLCTLGQVVGVVHPPPTTAWDNLIKDWLNWIWRHTMSQLLQSIFTPSRRERAGGGKFQKTSPQGWWFFPHKDGDCDEKEQACPQKLNVCVCAHIWSQCRVRHWSVIRACSLISHRRPQLSNQPNQTATHLTNPQAWRCSRQTVEGSRMTRHSTFHSKDGKKS